MARHLNLKLIFVVVGTFLQFSNFCFALDSEYKPFPSVYIGGGYLEGGDNHSGGVFQLEYRCKKCLWQHLRTRIAFAVPELSAYFLGAGLEWEWRITENFSITPSFLPGYYYKGKGRDLGCPLEFRSAIDLTYSFKYCSIGFQAFHISNAHLSNRNPGINGYLLFFGFPI